MHIQIHGKIQPDLDTAIKLWDIGSSHKNCLASAINTS